MTIEFNLQLILNELDVTAHKIAVETKSRPATVLQIAKGEVKRIEIELLDKMLIEFNQLAVEKGINKVYTVDDIITYKTRGNE